ncbi:MAG: hypothetical protein D8M59_16365 [Planctomycetes bacterium]|nr:hypothetical protein [Planctomycetota bacterium]
MFQVAEDEIIDQILIEIDSNQSDQAISDLIKLLDSAVQAIDGIEDVNKGNLKEIFDVIVNDLKYTNTWRLVYRRIKKLGRLADWVLRVAGLATIGNQTQ